MARQSQSAKPVLLVDDNAALREALAVALEAEGYTVIEAGDGEEALARLRGGLTPSIILLDLGMPGKNGEQFRAEQVMDPRLAAVPVVVMSGESGLREKTMALSVAGWAQKPVHLDEVLLLIARWRVV